MNITSIDNAIRELKLYDADMRSTLIGSESRIYELENRILTLENLIKTITDIDWKTVKFKEGIETF